MSTMRPVVNAPPVGRAVGAEMKDGRGKGMSRTMAVALVAAAVFALVELSSSSCAVHAIVIARSININIRGDIIDIVVEIGNW